MNVVVHSINVVVLSINVVVHSLNIVAHSINVVVHCISLGIPSQHVLFSRFPNKQMAWTVVGLRIEEQLLRRNVNRFRGGLVFKAHRPVYHKSRLENNKEEEEGARGRTC